MIENVQSLHRLIQGQSSTPDGSYDSCRKTISLWLISAWSISPVFIGCEKGTGALLHTQALNVQLGYLQCSQNVTHIATCLTWWCLRFMSILVWSVLAGVAEAERWGSFCMNCVIWHSSIIFSLHMMRVPWALEYLVNTFYEYVDSRMWITCKSV